MAKRTLTVVLRVLLGLVFVAASIAGMLQGAQPPPDYPAAGLAFMQALAHAGYFIVELWVVQVLAGVALVLGLWVPLALVVLAPVTVNILLFHVFLTPGLVFTVGSPGLAVFVLNAALLWIYREHYRGLLRPRAGR